MALEANLLENVYLCALVRYEKLAMNLIIYFWEYYSQFCMGMIVALTENHSILFYIQEGA